MLPRHFSLSLFRHVIARWTNQWAGFNCAISPALFFVTWSPNALLLVLPRTTKCLVTYLICRTHGCADSEDKSESVYVAILCLAERRHQFIIYVAHNIDNYTCLRALNMHLVQLPHRRDLLQQQQPLLLLLLLLHQLRHLLLLSSRSLRSITSDYNFYQPQLQLQKPACSSENSSPTISTTTTPTTFTCFACDSTTTSASSSTRDYDFHQYQRLLLPPVLPATIIPFIPYSDPSSVTKENRKRRERRKFSDQTIISTTTTIIREYSQWICFDISYPFSMTISSFEHENLPMHVDH